MIRNAVSVYGTMKDLLVCQEVLEQTLPTRACLLQISQFAVHGCKYQTRIIIQKGLKMDN